MRRALKLQQDSQTSTSRKPIQKQLWNFCEAASELSLLKHTKPLITVEKIVKLHLHPGGHHFNIHMRYVHVLVAIYFGDALSLHLPRAVAAICEMQ